MKLATNDVPVEFGGQVSQGEFRIKNSATAFAILSSGLYSNKYQAILRELGCNAYDSHVEAGCPEKPFTVHLPTRLNPIFSVRDYGVGLSHDQVMNLYTTYFESTKNNSNDFVGCMGLGSKSPFSYTKNFTITAIKNGTKGVYSAFIGDQGVPAIIQLLSEPTDEGNGVEVSFAVESRSDMSQFESEARKVYAWFQTRPEFTGVEVTIPPQKYAEENIIPGAHMRENSGYSNRSYALMGNVAYPIRVPEGEELPNGVRELFHSNSFVVRFEIGEIDIAASREELGYVPHTIEAIAAKGSAILSALEIYVVNKIKPAKTKWERNKLAAELMSSNRNLFSPIVENYLNKNPKMFVKGTQKQYNRLEIMLPLAELNKITGMKVTKKILRTGCNNISSLVNVPPSKHEMPKKLQVAAAPGTQYNPDNYWSVYDINAADTVIVFNDEKGNVLQRIRQAYADKDYKPLFEGKTTLFIAQAQNQTHDKATMFKYLKQRFGNAPILLTSQLPSLASSNTLGNQRVTVQKFVNKHNNNRYGNRTEYTFDAIYGKLKDIEPTIVDSKGKKTFLYVKLSHKSILRPTFDSSGHNQTWDATSMMDMINNSNITTISGLDPKRIYGVNKTSFNTVTKDKRWVSFFDYIEKEFDKIDWNAARDITERSIIAKQYKHCEYQPKHADQSEINKIAKRKSPAGILFQRWLAWYAQVKAAPVKTTDQLEYAQLISVMQTFFPNKDFTKSAARLDVTKIEEEYKTLFENVKTAYPMLRHLSLSENYHSKHWNEAIEYINLVDKAQSLC